MWGSDYPHHDATFPGAVDAIRATVAPCATATQAKVLGVNARGIYRLPARHTGPAALIGDYFTAVTAQDPALLRGLFSPDATFDVDGDVRHGHEEILSYYTENTFVFEDFRPDPGPLVVDGTTVTVDIDVHLGGNIRSVRDVFATDGQRITNLEVRGFADVLRAADSRNARAPCPACRAGSSEPVRQVGCVRRAGVEDHAGAGPAAPPSPRPAPARLRLT